MMNDPLSFQRSQTLPAISFNTQPQPQVNRSQAPPLVRYQGTPKRYEETRPALVQDFSHRKILGIGNEVYMRSLDLAENEKRQAVESAEAKVWIEAERIKNEALSDARKAAEIELEKALRKQSKALEKQRKEEALELELAMQRLARSQVQQERVFGEAKLKKAVEETEEKCHNELLKAVASAKEEVLKQETEKAAVAERKHQEELKKALQKAEQEKNNALQALKLKKEKEQDEAIVATTSKLQKLSEEEIKKLTEKYEESMKLLQSQISEKCEEIDSLLEANEKLEKQKTKLIGCLMHTREQFQMFVDEAQGFDRGQSDFIIPSLYPDVLEKI